KERAADTTGKGTACGRSRPDFRNTSTRGCRETVCGSSRPGPHSNGGGRGEGTAYGRKGPGRRRGGGTTTANATSAARRGEVARTGGRHGHSLPTPGIAPDRRTNAFSRQDFLCLLRTTRGCQGDRVT